MFLAYSSIFTTLDILKHICPHLDMFWQIQAYSDSWHSLTYSCILKHIKNPWLIQAYSEPLTVSDTTQVQFMHILNLNWADSDIFRTLTYLGSKCFTHIQAYSQTYTYRGILAYIEIKAYSESWHYPQQQSNSCRHSANADAIADVKSKIISRDLWFIRDLWFRHDLFCHLKIENIFSNIYALLFIFTKL